MRRARIINTVKHFRVKNSWKIPLPMLVDPLAKPLIIRRYPSAFCWPLTDVRREDSSFDDCPVHGSFICGKCRKDCRCAEPARPSGMCFSRVQKTPWVRSLVRLVDE